VTQLNRLVRLTIETDTTRRRLAADLRIQCQGQTGTGGDDAYGFVAYNLAPTSVALLRDPTARVTLTAGYRDGNVGIVAAGDVVRGSVRRKGAGEAGADVVVSWQVKPAQRARSIRVRPRSYTAVTAGALLGDVIGDGGLARGSIRLGQDTLHLRYVLRGTVGQALDRIAADTGSAYRLTHGLLDVWPRNESQTQRVQVISPTSGMVGTPEPADDGGVEVRFLVRPPVRPGTLLDIRSDVVSGRYRVDALRLDVDSWEGPFYHVAQCAKERAT